MGLTDKILVITQVPNSPDTNLMDLGLFRAIEAVYNRESPRNYEEIIECFHRTDWN